MNSLYELHVLETNSKRVRKCGIMGCRNMYWAVRICTKLLEYVLDCQNMYWAIGTIRSNHYYHFYFC